MNRRDLLLGLLAAGAASPAHAAPGLKIILLGQALLQHDVCNQADWTARDGFKAMFGRADVVFTDLESQIVTPEAGPPTRDPLLLHAAAPETYDCLRDLGVNLAATANNHAWDLGTGGIVGALPVLAQKGFTFAGTGRNLAEASAAAVLPTPRGTVALVAFATGAIREGAAATPTRAGVHEVRRGPDNELLAEDVERVLREVNRASKLADVTLLYHHNHYWEPDNRVTPPWQKVLARRGIDAGASVFVSHGAPVLHGVELYRGRPIFYDLGGFFFQTKTPEGRYGSHNWESLVAELEFRHGRFAGARLIPLSLNPVGTGGAADFVTRGRPQLATGDTAREILGRVQAASHTPDGRLQLVKGPVLILKPR